MRIKLLPEDFQVEELVRLRARQSGPYTLYRVHKQAVTTLDVQARMAHALGRPPAAVSLPALKDKTARVTQYATVHGDGPARVEGRGFVAERAGWVDRPLAPSDLLGNRFTIVVRDLGAEAARAICGQMERVTQEGLPNYFDQQRFGSQTERGDFPGRRIILRDAEGALHAHLAEHLAGDPPSIQPFKQLAAARWGDWDRLLAAAPRPSNYRSVLTFLRDHPADFRRALNLVTPRLLSLYLAAYQSLLWNRIGARFLLARLGRPSAAIEIGNESLPLFRDLSTYLPAHTAIPLPSHRARTVPRDLTLVFERVLEEEGLAQNDLKARILRNAYLSKGERKLLLLPQHVSASSPTPDDRFPGQSKVTLRFALPPGSYATLVLKSLLPSSAVV